MNTSLGIIITTIEKRRKALTWNIEHLIKYIDIPFTVYIYNDLGSPLKDYLTNLVKESNCEHVRVEVLNDNKEISTVRIGCGGGRYHLFEMAKLKHDIVASLDDDMQVTEGWFTAIKRAIDKHPNHSVFTGVMKVPGHNTLVAGSRIIIKENRITRKEIRSVKGEYSVADWGPLGCLVLCRKALQSNVKIPKLFVSEDRAFFLELKKLGINETIVVRDAVTIHRAIPVRSSNLRSPEKKKAAEEYYKKHYGLKLR